MHFNEDQLRKLASDDVRDLNPELFSPSSQRIPKANKFGAKRTEVDGHVFDSKVEAQRYRELLMMERAGLISDLQLQVPFILQESFVDADGNKQRKIQYTADFVYKEQTFTVIEDVKGAATVRGEAFRVRWRLLLNKFRSDPHIRCVLTR